MRLLHHETEGAYVRRRFPVRIGDAVASRNVHAEVYDGLRLTMDLR